MGIIKECTLCKSLEPIWVCVKCIKLIRNRYTGKKDIKRILKNLKKEFMQELFENLKNSKLNEN